MRDKARLRRMRSSLSRRRERSQVEAFLKSLVAPSAAGTPGVVVANQRETRIKPGEPLVSEVLARQRRQQELARDQEQWREFQQRQKAEAAAKHTRAAIKRAEAAARQNRAKLALAQALEKMDKLAVRA